MNRSAEARMQSHRRPEGSKREQYHRRAAGAAIGGAGSGLIGGLAAACCGPLIAPFAVAVLGASGAARIVVLGPWAPYLLGAGLVLLVYAYRAVWIARRCPPNSPSWRGRLDRVTPALLVFATVVWLASAGTYLAGLITGSPT